MAGISREPAPARQHEYVKNLVLLAVTCAPVFAQSPANGLRGPSVIQAGDTLVVDVGCAATCVYLGSVGSPARQAIPVGADRQVRIPVVGWTAGTMLIVSTDNLAHAETIIVEVIGTE